MRRTLYNWADVNNAAIKSKTIGLERYEWLGLFEGS